MKKAALYSSSRRAKAPPPAQPDAPATRSATLDAPAPGAVDATIPVGRLRRLWRRYDRPLLVLAGALFAIALVAMHAKMRSGALDITQKDIDAAVLNTLENTSLPSVEAKAYAAILPSVVRVVGIGPEEDDDEPVAKGVEKGTPPGGKGAAPGGKSPTPGGKGSFSVPGRGGDGPPEKVAGGGKNPPSAEKGLPSAEKGLPSAEKGQDKSTDRKDPSDKNADAKPKRRGGGVGTGVVIVDKGIILTNLHVVAGAQKIMITFFDGFEAEAVIIGMRPEHDLAVLQAKAVPDDMVAATLRSTADLQIGDHVVAVGFPFGIGPSASAGVVSGLKREYQSPEGKRILTNLIQFDAAANPGNSGGPLVTADGEVVGIVTGILNPTSQRVFIGIGFAVPIENAAAAVGMSPF
ncbi:MAG: trypsin-like peptidase domain-containing protein [Betaproteobacteria bacterium]